MMADDFLDLDNKDDKKDELILGKFKTPEDLAKAYSELEGKFTQTSQEAATIKQSVTDLEAKLQTATAKTVETKPEEEDENEYFINPKTAIQKALNKALEPLISGAFERDKELFKAANPDFAKYEARINEIVNNMPNLKTQPGIIGQLYKMVRGLDFDPATYEKEVREKLKKENQDKVDGSLAEGDAGELPGGGSKKVTLTEEEKRVARKFHPELTPDKAYARAVELKTKHGGGR